MTLTNLHFAFISFALLLSACANKNLTSTKALNQTNVEEPGDANFIGKHQAKAAILGVFHFNNPGLDTYKEKFSVDIMSAKRQAELEALLDKLAKYNPTKILLEVDRSKDSLINDRYIKYLNGEYKIDDKHSETHQIGFKLAKRLGHKRIYCCDAEAKWFGADLDWDNFDEAAYLKTKNQYDKNFRYDYNPAYAFHDSLKSAMSLTDYFIYMNTPSDRLYDHQAYLTRNVLTGAGDNYIGADGVARWYRRNLRVFSNAYDFANFESEDRLLLIYGAGHVWTLRQFFTDSPEFDYVEINDYLKE